jgi:hypothetical protein
MRFPILVGLPLVLVLGLARPAGGTNRYYSDVVSTSADGKLRLEAKSPDADKPFTLRFVWSGQRMRAMEKIEPPAWKGNKRDLED